MQKKATVDSSVRSARKAPTSRVRSRGTRSRARRQLDTVEIELAGGMVVVERGRVVELLKSGTLITGGASVLDRIGSITRAKLYSDSKVHHLEDRILDALRPLIHKQLGSIAAADIDLNSIGAPEELADSMAAALPGSHPFDELVGPFYDTSGLRKWLGLSRQRLNQRVKNHQMLACPLEGGGNVYPTWQFATNGTVLPGVRELLPILSQGTSDNWQIALWFSAPSERLNELSPKDWLLKGRRIGPVIELATETAARWLR